MFETISIRLSVLALTDLLFWIRIVSSLDIQISDLRAKPNLDRPDTGADWLRET